MTCVQVIHLTSRVSGAVRRVGGGGGGATRGRRRRRGRRQRATGAGWPLERAAATGRRRGWCVAYKVEKGIIKFESRVRVRVRVSVAYKVEKGIIELESFDRIDVLLISRGIGGWGVLLRMKGGEVLREDVEGGGLLGLTARLAHVHRVVAVGHRLVSRRKPVHHRHQQCLDVSAGGEPRGVLRARAGGGGAVSARP